MASSSWRRFAAAGALVAFLPLATVGCFGRFQLVRNVYDFNKDVSQDKWTQWLVFLVLTIVPVYGLASWIDALIANSIEFWTGENPVQPRAAAQTRVVAMPDGATATMTLRADRSIRVSVVAPDGSQQRFVLVHDGGSVAALAPDGTLLARVADVAGEPRVVGGSLAALR